MNRRNAAIVGGVIALILAATIGYAADVVTCVDSPGIGRIAVLIRTPAEARFPEGAPVVVNVSGFFVASDGFDYELDIDKIGAIYVTYLWPGKSDPRTGARSEGIYDYGGADCLRALRDVIRFALGKIPDSDGYHLDQLLALRPLYGNVGVYAFSHSGIAATNVLALHGESLAGVKYFVGRENPTIDPMYPLEPGYFTDDRRPVLNPYYDPAGYTPTSISIDYSRVGWLVSDEYPDGRPYFAVPGGEDYVCSYKHPRMWGKDYWSTDLLQALLDNGALTQEDWPEGLATPEEAARDWPFRTTVGNYARFRDVLPDLKVMLVFACDDHVQAAPDKPHIHQAYDGFRGTAGLWCRLNPDLAYSESLLGAGRGKALPDNPANHEPADWMASATWGYRGEPGSVPSKLVPLAAVAEMIDRVRADDWSDDLASVLFEWP